MSSPAAPSPRRIEDVPGQLPADLRLGVMHRRDLLQGDEQLDADTNGHQADDQPMQWLGDTDEYPAANAAASQNNGSHPRASRRTHADGQAHNAPQQDDEAFEDLDFPVQERAPRAHFTHLRHYLGAHAAGAAVRFVHGREAGRQTHDQVWADGEAARAEADANVGAWKRALAAGFAGLLAAAEEIRADLSVRFHENERIAALEHAAQIRRNAGERVAVDPVEYIRADRAVREAREARRAAAQPAQPGRPASMARPVRRAPHVPRRYGPELPGEPEDDQVSGVIDHLYHGEYELPHFGQGGNLTPQHYYVEPVRKNGVDAKAALIAAPSATPVEGAHDPAYWQKRATAYYDQHRPLGDTATERERAEWISKYAVFMPHQREEAIDQAWSQIQNRGDIAEMQRILDPKQPLINHEREAARAQEAARQRVLDEEKAKRHEQALARANAIADTFGGQLARTQVSFPRGTRLETIMAATGAAQDFVRNAANENLQEWNARGLNDPARRERIVQATAATIVREGLGETENLNIMLAGAFARELFGMELG